MLDLRSMDQDQLDALWRACYRDIENIVDKITYETIIKYIHPAVKDADTLELSLPKAWQRDQLGKFIAPIIDVVREKAGAPVNLSIIVKPNGSSRNTEQLEVVEQVTLPETFSVKLNGNGASNGNGTAGNSQGTGTNGNHREKEPTPAEPEMPGSMEKLFNPRYTFDTFVVGSGNRFAHAAALAVAESPGTTYNPLFVYGGVGLGKTHLISAIGQRYLMANHDARVVYVSMENFVNDMVESLQNKKMMEFRRKYRNVNVLLIDDIQFIKNKEAIQEEFFHTFNELHSAKAQIVITSDRPPKDIPTLEDRLRSRFEWGLIVDISPPDVETRMAILKKKAKTEEVDVPNEVIQYIAEKIPSNIRELEGALNRVIGFGSLMHLPITMDLALQALKTIIPDSQSRNLTVTQIQEKVCEYFSIRMEDLLGNCRESRLVMPRQVAMYLSKELISASYPNIGKAFGGRDHTTVMHACRKIDKNKRDPSLKHDLQNIRDLLIKHGG